MQGSIHAMTKPHYINMNICDIRRALMKLMDFILTVYGQCVNISDIRVTWDRPLRDKDGNYA